MIKQSKIALLSGICLTIFSQNGLSLPTETALANNGSDNVGNQNSISLLHYEQVIQKQQKEILMLKQQFRETNRNLKTAEGKLAPSQYRTNAQERFADTQKLRERYERTFAQMQQENELLKQENELLKRENSAFKEMIPEKSQQAYFALNEKNAQQELVLKNPQFAALRELITTHKREFEVNPTLSLEKIIAKNKEAENKFIEIQRQLREKQDYTSLSPEITGIHLELINKTYTSEIRAAKQRETDKMKESGVPRD